MTNPIGSSPSSRSAAAAATATATATTAPAPATTRPMGYPIKSAVFDALGGAVITGASWVYRPAVQTVIFGAVSTLIKRTANAAGNPVDTPEEEAAVACMSNVIADYGSGVVAGALHALATTFVGASRHGINCIANWT
ncbi:hypothetical protein HC248_00367 [Polaromonas vacuolata]|uniref:Uncharacterized protein n=1 Tax=Polaromonas vacuolata TaxID=37448 RepID=A0A6H2H678_9BURK|nr:hypothetical protein [Polaromonas vacuolata]QJC55104.1 hypothetical protein HC248_00367 [Polaromonas vacuolata]